MPSCCIFDEEDQVFEHLHASARETGAAAGSLAVKHGITGHMRCPEMGFRFDSAVIGAIDWAGGTCNIPVTQGVRHLQLH